MAGKSSSNPVIGFISWTAAAIFFLSIFFYFTSGGTVDADGIGDIVTGYLEFLLDIAHRLSQVWRDNIPQG